MTALHYTRRDFRSELEREIKMRERVFPAWVAAGKLTKEDAETRIAILRALLIHVQTCATIHGSEPQGELFR